MPLTTRMEFNVFCLLSDCYKVLMSHAYCSLTGMHFPHHPSRACCPLTGMQFPHYLIKFPCDPLTLISFSNVFFPGSLELSLATLTPCDPSGKYSTAHQSGVDLWSFRFMRFHSVRHPPWTPFSLSKCPEDKILSIAVCLLSMVATFISLISTWCVDPRQLGPVGYQHCLFRDPVPFSNPSPMIFLK